MNDNKIASWTRRRLLKTIPATLAPALLSGKLWAALPAAKPAPPFSRFVDVAQAAGLTESMIYGDPGPLYNIVESMGSGCAFLDYDNDGWMDIFVLGGRRLENTPPNASNRLYKNNRDGTFTDVTAKAGLLDSGWAQGVCVGDYNNDGFEDLFLTYYGQNRLYRNNGDGTFTDVTAKAGLLHPATRYSTGCAFLDYNRDGLLDLFVSNYLEIDLATCAPAFAVRAQLQLPGCADNVRPAGPAQGAELPLSQQWRRHVYDVSKESGIAGCTGSYGLTAISIDADEDGWPDIFVACDSTPSMLLLNNHDGTFREEALFRGVALSGDGQQMGGMGVCAGDYNLDGHTDLVKTHYYNQATGLYRNDGKGNFDDVTIVAGLNKETRFVCFGAGLVDFDNDGYPDILLTTGSVYPEVDRLFPNYPARSPRILFRNQGDGTFVEMGSEAGPGISARHMSRGAAFGDFDNDGDMDVLIMNVNEPPSLLRNDAPHGQSLDQDSPGRHKEQSQRHWRACRGALRRQGAGAGVVERIQLSFGQRSAAALRPGRGHHRGYRDPLAAGRGGEVSRACCRPTSYHSRRPRHCEGPPFR
jgi:hypothetical protein